MGECSRNTWIHKGTETPARQLSAAGLAGSPEGAKGKLLSINVPMPPTSKRHKSPASTEAVDQQGSNAKCVFTRVKVNSAITSIAFTDCSNPALWPPAPNPQPVTAAFPEHVHMALPDFTESSRAPT